MNGLAPILGVLGGLAGIADTVPYVRDTVRGSTRPHRGSWMIWGVLAVIACLSQRADGASWSVLMTATQAILTGLVFLLAIRYGEGGVSPVDLLLIALAGAGILGWALSQQPVVALGCVIAADLTAVAMMTPKLHSDPDSETLSTYALASVGGAFAAGAVSRVDVSMLLYPVYFCLVNGATAAWIHRRRSILKTLGPGTCTPGSKVISLGYRASGGDRDEDDDGPPHHAQRGSARRGWSAARRLRR